MSKQVEINAEFDNEHLEGSKKRKIDVKHRTFIHVHFQTVQILLRLKVNSYEKSLFLLMILCFLMSLTNLNVYLTQLKGEYSSISTSTASYSLVSSLQYLDIAQLINLGGSASEIAAIVCSVYMIAMTLFYIACLAKKILKKGAKPRKFFYGRWFMNMASFFTQLLSFPFMLLFSAYVFCSSEVLGTSSNSCSNSTQILTFIFSLIGLILVVINELWMGVFLYNNKIFKKDAMCIDKDPRIILEWSLFRALLAVFTSLQDRKSYAFFIMFLAVLSLLTLYLTLRLSLTMGRFSFGNSSIQKAFTVASIFFLSQYSAFLTDELCRATGIYANNEEKFVIFLPFYLIILFPIVIKLRAIQLRYVLFQPCDLSRVSFSRLIFKISLFQQLNSQSSSSTYLQAMFKGLLNEHLYLPCPHPNLLELCFCRKRLVYDTKKRKDTPVDKLLYSQNSGIFTKFLLKSWYETYLYFNQNDIAAHIAYAEFLYFKMKNVSLTLKTLALLSNKYLPPLTTYRLFRLNELIIKQNRKRNHDSYRLNQGDKDNRNKLEIETVIPMEEQISSIQQGIKSIIKNNIRFWAYLEKTSISLSQINHLANFSLRQLDVLKQIWKDCNYYIDYRKKWRFYFCWYYLYILNKKIKVAMMERFSGTINVNESDVFSEELQQENAEDDVNSVASNMKVDEMEKIFIKRVEMAFDKNSVVFNIGHEYKGKILKVSRSVYNAFGYSQMELSGQLSITTLMPRVYQNIHPQMILKFSQTGKAKTLYSQRKIFCLNKQGCIFPAWKFVKQYVTLTGKCEYVALIRPIPFLSGQKIFFIVLTEDWEVDSMTDALYEGLGLDPLKYQNESNKLLLNLLLLSPRLLRYTKFCKYLTEADYRLFMNRDIDRKRLSKENSILQQVQKLANNNNAQKIPQLSKFNKDSFLKQLSRNTSLENDVGNFPQPSSPRRRSIENPTNPSETITVPPIQQDILPASEDKSQVKDLIMARRISQQGKMQESSPSSKELTQKLRSDKKRKITVIPSVIINSPKFEPMIDNDAHDQAKNDSKGNNQLKDNLDEHSHSLTKNSTQDIVEELNMGYDQQFMQTNYIRDEILKKKKQQQQQNQSGSIIEEEEDAQAESEKDEVESDDEGDNEENRRKDLDGDEKSENDDNDDDEESVNQEFEKLDHLEKGDSVHFRLRIPTDFNQMLVSYQQKVTQIGYNKNSSHRITLEDMGSMKPLSSNKAVSQQLIPSGKTGNINNNYSTQPYQENQSRDKSLYLLMKELFLKYNFNKHAREFNATCTASFKKAGKHKIIIMKLNRFEENHRKIKNPKTIQKQNSATPSDPKRLLSIASGQFEGILRQNSNQEGTKISQAENSSRLGQYVSMRSELSDARESILSNTIQKNKNMILTDEQANDGLFSKQNGLGYQSKIQSYRIVSGEIDELADQHSNRSLNTFHKDFALRSGAKNLSLNPASNIFLKEDNHKPNKNIPTITNIKIFMRLFFLLLLSLSGFTFFYGPSYQFPLLLTQSNQIFQAKNVLLSSLQSYSLILDQLMINSLHYSSSISSSIFWTTSTFQSMVIKQFNSECVYFYGISSDTGYRSTFFDTSTTPYSLFTKEIFSISTLPSGFVQKDFKIDSYDLYSQMVFFLQSIQEISPASLTISYEPVAFFRTNIFPNIYDALKKGQRNLQDGVNSTANEVYNFLLIIIFVESFLALISFAVLFRLIFVVCNTFKSVIEVFPTISQRDLRKIKNYNINLDMNFSYIVEKDDFLSGTHSMFQVSAKASGQTKSSSNHNGSEYVMKKQEVDYNLDEPNDGTENVGKKQKDIVDGGFLKDLRMKTFSFYGVFVACMAAFTGTFLYLIMSSILTLQLIISNGGVFMDNFESNTAMMIAAKEKYLDKTNYNSILKPAIQSVIDTYLTSNLQPQVDSLSEVNFDDNFNAVFYGNPCVLYSSLFTEDSTYATSTECLTVASGSLQQGAASFNSFYKNAFSNYINNGLDGDTLSASTIFDYNRGVYYVDLFLVDLIKIWGDNTNSYLNNQLSIIIIFVIIMFIVLLLVYLIVSEKFLLGKFTSDYAYFRTIYNMYMPDLIIAKEKRIKFWLVKYSVINK